MYLRSFSALSWSVLGLAFWLGGCTQAPVQTPATELAISRPQVVVSPGAWKPLAIDAGVWDLADYAAASLGDPKTDPLVEVLSARAQRVAGTHYALELELKSGTRWRVGLFRDRDGLLQITDTDRL